VSGFFSLPDTFFILPKCGKMLRDQLKILHSFEKNLHPRIIAIKIKIIYIYNSAKFNQLLHFPQLGGAGRYRSLDKSVQLTVNKQKGVRKL